MTALKLEQRGYWNLWKNGGEKTGKHLCNDRGHQVDPSWKSSCFVLSFLRYFQRYKYLKYLYGLSIKYLLFYDLKLLS